MSPTLILTVILLYFCVLFAVSYIAGRKADSATFFSGSRKSPWLLVGISTMTAAMSGVTFVSVPGMVGTTGWSYMQMVAGFTVGQLILAYGLVPLYYKYNLTSIYRYLEQRLGMRSYRTGAWFFFVSKMLGASVRLFIVTEVLQLLVCAPLGVPYWLNVLFTVAVVYLCTFRGGVKSVLQTDLLQTICLTLSVALCIYWILKSGRAAGEDYLAGICSDPMTRIFRFDNPKEGTYFWKQFIAGIVLLVGTTGIDQDMMQRTLSCRSAAESRKNILLGAGMQIVVIGLFLFLGYLLYTYAARTGVDISALKPDDVFPYLATGGFFPQIVGVLFVVGFIASAYSAACGSLTALTTSFTIDLLGSRRSSATPPPTNQPAPSTTTPTNQPAPSTIPPTNQPTLSTTPPAPDHPQSAPSLDTLRRIVHPLMALCMAGCISVIHVLNNDSVIQTVFLVAGYTNGPLLGMFLFGILTRRRIRDRWLPLVAIAAPVITYIIDINSAVWFNGYVFSHERLVLNALLTFIGIYLLSIGKPKSLSHSQIVNSPIVK